MSVSAPTIVPVARGGESCHPLSRIHEMDPANLVGEAAGVWSCSPCTERIDAQPCDEFCQVLEGTVVLTSDDGTVHEFGPGDGFVVPKGWAGTWHMPVAVRKTYVVLDPVTGSGGATDAA